MLGLLGLLYSHLFRRVTETPYDVLAQDLVVKVVGVVGVVGVIGVVWVVGVVGWKGW